jgi:hypothetical protein
MSFSELKGSQLPDTDSGVGAGTTVPIDYF